MTYSISNFPKDIVIEIFKFLSPEQLGRVSCVCKSWNQLGASESLWGNFDLKKLFPKLTILDEAVWKTHIDLNKYQLSFEDAPPSNNRQIIPLIKDWFATLKIENDAGITLLTLPQGHSYNKAREFAQRPLKGNPTQFRYTWYQSPPGLGDTLVMRTHRVLITNDILVGSRKMTLIDQKDLLDKVQVQCQLPELLALATLAILTYITSIENPPKRLLSDVPTTYSRCSDMIDNYNMVCGGYSEIGFGVDSFSNIFHSNTCGVVAYQKIDN